MGDNVQIIQLLQNLIGNAIKFKGNNPPNIHISAKDNEDEWLFSISDNGIGIDQNIRNRYLVFLKDYILEKNIWNRNRTFDISKNRRTTWWTNLGRIRTRKRFNILFYNTKKRW